MKFDNEDILFNLCEQKVADSSIPAECTGVDGDYYAYVIRQDGTCIGMKAADDQKADTFALDIRNSDGELDGVSLNYVGSEVC